MTRAGKRWPVAALLVALLASSSAIVGSGSTAALAEAVADPLSLIAGRSPGSRPEGALFATKPDRKVVREAVDAVMPTARLAQPPMEGSSLPETTFAALDPGVVPLPVGAETFAAGPAPEVAVAGMPGGPIFDGPTAGLIIPIGGGTDSPSGGPTPDCCTSDTPTDPDTPLVPAVPEPSTWAMLILGFFMVGATLRARATKAAIRATA